MAQECGREGNVVWAGKLPTSAVIREWAGDFTVDVFDATGMSTTPPRGEGIHTGLHRASGTIAFIASDTAPAEVPGGSAVRLKLYVNSVVYYEFDAKLIGSHPSCVVDGEALLVYDFRMSDTGGFYFHGTSPSASPVSSPH